MITILLRKMWVLGNKSFMSKYPIKFFGGVNKYNYLLNQYLFKNTCNFFYKCLYKLNSQEMLYRIEVFFIKNIITNKL